MQNPNIWERYLQGKYINGNLRTSCLILRITAATQFGVFVFLSVV